MTIEVTPRAATTRLITERLRRVKEGEVISYDQLAVDVGVSNVKRREIPGGKIGFDSLMTARRNLLKEGVFFEVIRGYGLRRLSPSEIARGEGPKTVQKIQRVAKRGMRIVKIALTSNEISNEDRIRANTDAAVLGALILFTNPEKAKKIEGAIRKGQMNVSFGATLKLFNKNGVSEEHE